MEFDTRFPSSPMLGILTLDQSTGRAGANFSEGGAASLKKQPGKSAVEDKSRRHIKAIRFIALLSLRSIV